MEESLKSLARKAKKRLKSGFWENYKSDYNDKLELAKQQGLNESKASRFLKTLITEEINGKDVDEFYLKVKKLLSTEGEVSNAIGKLTDREYYNSLSYEEKQRYTLDLSAKYLKALERYRRECEFEKLSTLK